MILKSNTLSTDNYHKIHVVFLYIVCDCRFILLKYNKLFKINQRVLDYCSTKLPINRLGYSSKIDISIKNHLQAMGKIIHPLFQSCN